MGSQKLSRLHIVRCTQPVSQPFDATSMQGLLLGCWQRPHSQKAEQHVLQVACS